MRKTSKKSKHTKRKWENKTTRTSNIEDKIVQKAVVDILEAIYEQDFFKCSFGYKPNVGQQKTVKDISIELMKIYSLGWTQILVTI
jgi:hypothetical protein